MLEANIALFRRLLPGCSIVVAAGSGWDGSRLGVEVVSRLEFSPDSETARDALLQMPDTAHPAVRAALACDALIISGGGNLSGTWPHHICERLAMARIAASHRAPVILLGQTLGPSFRERERTLVSELLQLSTWVGLRETYSYALALELGAASDTLSYQLDDAIFLAPERAPADVLEKIGVNGTQPWIAVTVHPIGELSVHNPVIAQLASSLRGIAKAAGAHLVFLPHVAFENRGDTPDDAEFGALIGRALYGNPPLPIAPILPAAQALWLTQQASLVISTRYHPLVFALAGSVPALAIWSDEYTRKKSQGALIHAGRPADAMSIEDLLAGSIPAKAIELWRMRDAVKNELQHRVRMWRETEELRAEKLKHRLLLCRSGKWPN